MKICVKFDAVRLRRSPEFLDANILSLLPAGTVLTDAERQGDWWKTPNGFIHASMAEGIQVQESPIASDPADPLTVPYRSQWDVDAGNRISDCGQTCVAMLAAWRGIRVEIKDLRFQQSENGVSNAQDLIKNFESVGLAANMAQLPVAQTPPLPAICLIWYGGLERSSIQDKAYRGWHWLILLAHNHADVITHDPDFWGQRRSEGSKKQFSMAEWMGSFIPYTNSNSMTTAVILAE